MRPMSTSKPIHIFKAGTHTANNGVTMLFSEADLKASAAAYDPTLHEAPLVVGHPATNAPAYGWVKLLSVDDGGLLALPDQVDVAFAELVKLGRYKKISPSFYPPTSPKNPKPGVFYLRHVGFLGARPPAIKGLKPVEFDDADDCITLEITVDSGSYQTAKAGATNQFSEPGEPMTDEERARLATLEAENKTLKQKEASFAERDAKLLADSAQLAAEKAGLQKTALAEFAEQQIKAGKLLPKDKLGAIEFMASLAKGAVLEFGEGDSKTKQAPLDWFKAFVAGLPPQVEFGEISGDHGQTANTADAESIRRAAQAYQFAEAQAGRDVSGADAVAFVMKNGGKQ